MRNMHKTTAIVAVLGMAFGVTACGPDTKSISPGITKSVDESLKTDLRNVATVIESFSSGGATEYTGIEVAPSTPGGRIDFRIDPSSGDHLRASPGNVIAVNVVENGKGYCISGYNKSATTATSATKSLIYQSNKGGLRPAVGAC